MTIGLQKEQIMKVEYSFKEFNVDNKQRRYDSLARVLSPKREFTPCVAVAMSDGKLLVASNSDSHLDTNSYIKNKAKIVGEFLNTLRAGFIKEDEQVLYRTKGLFFSQDQLTLADQTVDELEKQGGLVSIPHDYAEKKKRQDCLRNKYVKKQLLKVAKYYLLGWDSREVISGDVLLQDSFDFDEVEVLTKLMTLTEGESSLIICKPKALGRKVKAIQHAEQIIANTLETDKDTFPKFQAAKAGTIHVGINKLCCATCAQALQSKDKFVVRGVSGCAFNGTLNNDTGIITKIARQRISDVNMNAEDSDTDFDEESKNPGRQKTKPKKQYANISEVREVDGFPEALCRNLQDFFSALIGIWAQCDSKGLMYVAPSLKSDAAASGKFEPKQGAGAASREASVAASGIFKPEQGNVSTPTSPEEYLNDPEINFESSLDVPVSGTLTGPEEYLNDTEINFESSLDEPVSGTLTGNFK